MEIKINTNSTNETIFNHLNTFAICFYIAYTNFT